MVWFKKKSMEELKAEREKLAAKLKTTTEREKVKSDIKRIRSAEFRQKYGDWSKKIQTAGTKTGKLIETIASNIEVKPKTKSNNKKKRYVVYSKPKKKKSVKKNRGVRYSKHKKRKQKLKKTSTLRYDPFSVTF